MRRSYCDWDTTQGQALGEPYAEEEARRRFDAGERCTLLVGDDVNHPGVVLGADGGGTTVTVTWLDALQRPELMYRFAVQFDTPRWPPNQLLLDATRITMYDDADEQRLPDVRPAYTEYYAFAADGRYNGIRGRRGHVDVEETTGALEPEHLEVQMEPVPRFGDWDSLLRQER